MGGLVWYTCVSECVFVHVFVCVCVCVCLRGVRANTRARTHTTRSPKEGVRKAESRKLERGWRREDGS